MTKFLSVNQFYALILLLVLLLVSFVVIFLLRYTPISDPHLMYSRIKQGFLATSEKTGLSLERVVLSGNAYLSDPYILEKANLYPEKPMLSVIPREIGHEVWQSGGWVKNITVKRSFSEGVFIKVEEQKPLAFWQSANSFLTYEGEKLHMLDESAYAALAWQEFRSLPLIEGEGEEMPKKWAALRETLRIYPKILNRIAIYRWIGKRRWNLILKNGEVVLLPDTDIDQALVFLERLQDRHRIFDRNFERLDVRFKGRLIVKEKASGDEFHKGVTVMLDKKGL